MSTSKTGTKNADFSHTHTYTQRKKESLLSIVDQWRSTQRRSYEHLARNYSSFRHGLSPGHRIPCIILFIIYERILKSDSSCGINTLTAAAMPLSSSSLHLRCCIWYSFPSSSPPPPFPASLHRTLMNFFFNHRHRLAPKVQRHLCTLAALCYCISLSLFSLPISLSLSLFFSMLRFITQICARV